MSKEEKFWDLIGVKPNVLFKLKNEYRMTTNVYYFDSMMNLKRNSGIQSEGITLYDIISGRETIVPVQLLTQEDKLILEYAKLIGCNWVAKDEDGDVYGYIDKPVKSYNWWKSTNKAYKLYYDISILSWEDAEPYEIS